MAIVDFTLGADPEFVCFKGGRFWAARHSGFLDLADELGGDMSGRPFEVRPRPSKDPLEVVSNIHSILVGHTLRNPAFYALDWRAGSYYHTGGNEGHDTSLGGHIHIGGLKKLLPAAEAGLILDNYVGAISVLVEDRKEGMKRRGEDVGGEYGQASDVRDDMPHGYEYRTPSSWLTSPYVAAGFLCLTKAIIWDVMNRKGFVPLTNDLDDEIGSMRTKVLREYYTTRIRPSIESLSLYPTYQPYLDFLHFLITHRLTWYPKVSMKHAWGIASPASYPERRPTLATLWKEFGAGRLMSKEHPQ
jgi:hypothetical protein